MHFNVEITVLLKRGTWYFHYLQIFKAQKTIQNVAPWRGVSWRELKGRRPTKRVWFGLVWFGFMAHQPL